MYKLNKYAVTAFYSLFFTILLWLFCNCMINTKNSFIDLNLTYISIGIMLIAITFICSYCYCHQFFNYIEESKIIYRIILMLIIVILCYSGIAFAVKPRIWDLGTVYDSAYELAIHDKLGYDYLDRYFKRFPNNIGILIFLTQIYKVVAFFGVTTKAVYIYVGIAVNIIMIMLSVVITYKLCIILFSKIKAILFLIMILFCSPIYLYASTFYTDTIAMLFPPLIIYLYIKYDKSKNVTLIKKIVYLFFISFFSFLGSKMKMTVLIVLIAIAVLLVLQRRYIDLIKRSLAIIVTISILSLSFNFVINRSHIFSFNMKESGTVPYTHWIMMGMTGHGGWSEKEYKYTYSFKTVEEARKGDIKVIKDRLSEYKLNGYLKFLTHKAIYTWQNGTYSSMSFADLSPIKRTYAHEFVTASGKHKKYLQYFAQCYHILILSLVLIGLFKRIYKKQIDYLTIIYLSLFGLLLFLLIWETTSRYLVHFIPIIYICALDGCDVFESVFSKINLIRKKIKTKRLSVLN